MKSFLLIVAVILWVALRSNAAKAKRKAAMEESASQPSQPSYSSVRSAFESLFAEEDEAQSVNSTFAEEGKKAGYYSYETVDEPEPMYAQAETAANRSACPNPAETEEKPSAADFDLRQAIIYQTILSNKYLDEMHTAEN